jgi:hypothetical protein
MVSRLHQHTLRLRIARRREHRLDGARGAIVGIGERSRLFLVLAPELAPDEPCRLVFSSSIWFFKEAENRHKKILSNARRYRTYGRVRIKTGALNHSTTLPRLQNQELTDMSSATVLATCGTEVACRDLLAFCASKLSTSIILPILACSLHLGRSGALGRCPCKQSSFSAPLRF